MEQEFLKRYTELPFLLYLLRKRKLTLLSPTSWEDRNDAHFMLTYQRKRECGSVLALCFTHTSETFHHWKIFSGSSSGICIDLDYDRFRGWLVSHPYLKFQSVDYRKLPQEHEDTFALGELPFLKRHAYRDECEMRLVYEAADRGLQAFDVDFELAVIRRIVLSPWLPKSVAQEVVAEILGIEDCADLDVTRTTLLENARWKRHGDDCQ
jgi:hypothetical protein